MAKWLTYSDAVKLLGGSNPAVDNLLGGLLSLATAGGSDAALSWFDAKTEMVRLGHVVTGKLRDAVRGYGRFDRNSDSRPPTASSSSPASSRRWTWSRRRPGSRRRS